MDRMPRERPCNGPPPVPAGRRADVAEKKRGRGKGRTRPKRRHKWIGGRLSPPIFLHDREEPYRPELVIWLAASSGLVVGQDAVAPEDAEGAVARALLAALDRPLAGPKHRPDVIRVAGHALAAEVRAAVADTIPVIVAPVPELDTVVKGLIEWMPDTDEGDSYFEGGRIPPEVVAELFTAAAHLYRTAPWKVVADTQVIGMDVPALGVEGACVSVLGHLGANLGVLICPSLAGYEAFGRTAAGGALEGDGPVDLGTHSLSLNFVRGADLPGSMRREAATHAWPVAGPDAYPLAMGVERDGAFRPLVPRDLKEDPAYVFLRPGGTRHGNMGDTVLGRAVVSGETLRIETNSRERADALRKRVETACGDRIRHRGREHADPLPDKAALALPDSAPESLSPVPAQLALELKQHHYADWPDQPLPALKGRTPRETVRTAEGRAAVDDLLKDMENEEQRSPPGAAFDFSEVRRTLGLG